MTTFQKRLTLILCVATCAAQTPLHGMDHLKKILGTVSSTSSSLWGNDTFRKALGAYIVLCIAREAYVQYYYNKKSHPLVRIAYTPVGGVLVQPVKLPIDVTKSCIKYCWNLLQNNPRFTAALLNIPATLCSSFISSLVTSGIINSGAFERALNSITKTGMTDSIKYELMRSLYATTDSMIRPVMYTGMHNVVLYDEVQHNEELNHGGKKLKKDIDLNGIESEWFDDLPEPLQTCLEQYTIDQANTPRSYILHGRPGTGKTASVCEFAKRLGATKSNGQFFVMSGAEIFAQMYVGWSAKSLRISAERLIKQAQDNPHLNYVILIDDGHGLFDNRGKQKTDSQKDNSNTVDVFREVLDWVKDTPNCILINTTNFATGVERAPESVDAAVFSRMKQITIPELTHEKRTALLQGFLKVNNCTIDPETFTLLLDATESFATRYLENLIKDMCSTIKSTLKNNSPFITKTDANIASIIYNKIFEQLDVVINETTNALITVQDLQRSNPNLQKNSDAYKTLIQKFENKKTEIYHNMRPYRMNSMKEVLKPTQNAIHNLQQRNKVIQQLLEEQNSLPTTEEQKLCAHILAALEKNDISCVIKEFKKFDSKETLFQTSLNKQAKLLTSIINNMNLLISATTFNVRTLNVSLKLIDELKQFPTVCTYYNKNNVLVYANTIELITLINLEKQQETIIIDAIDLIQNSVKKNKLPNHTALTNASEQCMQLLHMKKGLDAQIRENADIILDLFTKSSDTLDAKLEVAKHNIKNLAKIVLTRDQLQLQTVMDALDAENNSKELSVSDIEKLFNNQTLEISQEDIKFDDLNLLENKKEEITPFEIKEEVVSDQSTPRTHALLPTRTVRTEENEMISPQPKNDTFNDLQILENVKKLKPIAKQVYNRAGNQPWIYSFFCNPPKASGQEKNAPTIAWLLKNLIESFASTSRLLPTITPENLVVIAQALQEQPDMSSQHVCALLAGYQSDDQQIIDMFRKPKCTKKEVIDLFDAKTKLLCVKNQQDEDITNSENLWLDMHKEEFKKDFKISFGVPQQVKKVEDSAKLIASVTYLAPFMKPSKK